MLGSLHYIRSIEVAFGFFALFTMVVGRIDKASEELGVGDLIFPFNNVPLPMIFRPTGLALEERKKNYELVSPVYIYGAIEARILHILPHSSEHIHRQVNGSQGGARSGQCKKLAIISEAVLQG